MFQECWISRGISTRLNRSFCAVLYFLFLALCRKLYLKTSCNFHVMAYSPRSSWSETSSLSVAMDVVTYSRTHLKISHLVNKLCSQQTCNKVVVICNNAVILSSCTKFHVTHNNLVPTSLPQVYCRFVTSCAFFGKTFFGVCSPLCSPMV